MGWDSWEIVFYTGTQHTEILRVLRSQSSPRGRSSVGPRFSTHRVTGAIFFFKFVSVRNPWSLSTRFSYFFHPLLLFSLCCLVCRPLVSNFNSRGTDDGPRRIAAIYPEAPGRAPDEV